MFNHCLQFCHFCVIFSVSSGFVLITHEFKKVSYITSVTYIFKGCPILILYQNNEQQYCLANSVDLIEIINVKSVYQRSLHLIRGGFIIFSRWAQLFSFCDCNCLLRFKLTSLVSFLMVPDLRDRSVYLEGRNNTGLKAVKQCSRRFLNIKTIYL